MRNNKQFLKDGIILLNKSKGISSFGAINKMKWLLNMKKVGHAGTLDPMAEGLLIVMTNNATKFSDDLMKKDKEYYVEMELGYETDSYDAEGNITKKYNEKIQFELEYIKKVVNDFLGIINQIPPMYSAIKMNGEKLYELARKGIEVERKSREVKINYIRKIKYENNKISFYVNVSSGTYIRSLVRDIGEKLGVYATMTKLVRTKINNYSLSESVTLEDAISYFENIQAEKKEEEIICLVKFKNIDTIFKFIEIEIDEEEYKKIKNGMTIIINKNKFSKKIKINDKVKIIIENTKEFKGIAKVISIKNEKIYLKREKYFI